MPGLIGRGLAALLVLWLSGCAAPQATALRERPSGLPAAATVAGVPFYTQADAYCGPASLAMALTWSGLPVSQEEVARRVFVAHRDGTLRSDMIGGARRHGRLAVPLDDLRGVLGELAAGHPVVVFQNLGLSWYPRWHYAVAVGYDLDAGEIHLRSGDQERQVLSLYTFEHTWARGGHWALAVLPPDRLPATVPAAEVMRAAFALERGGHPEAAAETYAAMTARWPNDPKAWIGLGNLRHAVGDFAGAAHAFRGAVEADPQMAEAWNNLAVALAEGGQPRQALAAVREAIRLDPEAGTFRETEREIAEAMAR